MTQGLGGLIFEKIKEYHQTTLGGEGILTKI